MTKHMSNLIFKSLGTGNVQLLYLLQQEHFAPDSSFDEGCQLPAAPLLSLSPPPNSLSLFINLRKP